MVVQVLIVLAYRVWVYLTTFEYEIVSIQVGKSFRSTDTVSMTRAGVYVQFKHYMCIGGRTVTMKITLRAQKAGCPTRPWNPIFIVITGPLRPHC